MRLPFVDRPVLAAAFAWAVLPLAAPAAPAPPPGPDPGPAVNPAETVREGLERVVSLKLDRQTLSQAVSQLGEKAKLRIVLDVQAIQQIGVAPEQTPVSVRADLKDVKARAVLRTLLAPSGLNFIVVGDAVLVTTDEAATVRQLSQRVSVHLDKVGLAGALKQIAQQTGVNLALDPRAEKEAAAPVSLDLDDVPLETAVRLLSEMAGLKPVRVGNALFVTQKQVAAEMRADPDLVPPAPKPYLFLDRDSVMTGPNTWQIGGAIPAAPPTVSPPGVPPAVPNGPPPPGDW